MLDILEEWRRRAEERASVLKEIRSRIKVLRRALDTDDKDKAYEQAAAIEFAINDLNPDNKGRNNEVSS